MSDSSYTMLVNKLEAFNQKKCELDEAKIRAVFEYIGLKPADYKEGECFKWDRILISVPDQKKFIELQQLENLCENVEFLLNRHSDAYFVCDYEDWRRASLGKGMDELDKMLRKGFGSFSRN
ncbi:hypothetical protein [Flavobacterium sp.]|uniref:hypothetical protein n=1 Tax=Flavobacterium sp. TaxID=239 RepID=UPI00121E803C|nr:hypothetical protein [Flavobacterium sp.]RZJ73059.1 MAG: hypothetical protein EOO49_05350 [Flavobacterium sp.]